MFPKYYLAIASFFQQYGMPDSMIGISTTVTLWLAVVLIAAAAYWIFTRPVTWLIQKAADKTPTKWDDYVLTDPMMRSVGLMIVAFMLVKMIPGASLYMSVSSAATVIKILKILSVGSILWFVICCVNVLYNACEKQNIEAHGLLVLRNFIKAAAAAVAVIVMLSILLDRNIAYIISGLGAMAAILTLIFRDTILGLVAGVKLTLNKSLKKGDWISVPAFGANGEVIDVGISVVKVRNWDNSVSSVPPYALISGGFQNFQEMKRSGGRRIQRSVNIDVNSVRFLSPEELSPFKGEKWTEGIDLDRRQVNLSLFRRYLERKILAADGFRNDMLNMVRELQPGPEGIPVEIYLFTSNVDWRDYELSQADLMDTILASVDLFGLRLFQHPSGIDLRPLLTQA